MSTKHRLAKIFEVIEMKNINAIHPCLVEGVTYKVLPSTFVAGLVGVGPRC